MKTETIRVEVSPEQAKLFRLAASNHKTEPGNIVLALACDRLMINPTSEDPNTALDALLWYYVGQRDLPVVDREWQRASFLGFKSPEPAKEGGAS